MTGMIANLLLNVVIIGLLAATIGYCWVLNRRIKILQDSKSELAQLLQHFDESTTRASESIIALQSASKKIGENIQHRIDKANYLIDDLSFMIERGGKLTSQMEAGMAVSRARSRVMAEEKIPEESDMGAKTAEASKSKPSEKPSKERAVASLEAVLEKIVGRNKNVNNEEDMEVEARGKSAPRGRSKTEQELLDMLRAGMKG
jgi:hypothetical protein